MTILENVLEDNKKFVENFEGEEMSHHAQKKLAILTCMDCRLIDFFEPALGLERGDAKIVRNAGNSIVGEDAIRSIGAALYNLGCEEVLVVGHTECGMAGADADALKEKMLARGMKVEVMTEIMPMMTVEGKIASIATEEEILPEEWAKATGATKGYEVLVDVQDKKDLLHYGMDVLVIIR